MMYGNMCTKTVDGCFFIHRFHIPFKCTIIIRVLRSRFNYIILYDKQPHKQCRPFFSCICCYFFLLSFDILLISLRNMNNMSDTIRQCAENAPLGSINLRTKTTYSNIQWHIHLTLTNIISEGKFEYDEEINSFWWAGYFFALIIIYYSLATTNYSIVTIKPFLLADEQQLNSFLFLIFFFDRIWKIIIRVFVSLFHIMSSMNNFHLKSIMKEEQKKNGNRFSNAVCHLQQP